MKKLFLYLSEFGLTIPAKLDDGCFGGWVLIITGTFVDDIGVALVTFYPVITAFAQVHGRKLQKRRIPRKK